MKTMNEDDIWRLIIQFVKEEEKRKLYVITDLGWEVLKLEFHRIDRLYRNMKEMI